VTRILVTGASGLLGHNICPALAARHKIVAAYLTHPTDVAPGIAPVRLDITKPADVEALMKKVRPAAVVHAAALSRPDQCEKDSEAARRVIVSGTQNVAAACAANGARLVYISSDLVFDGLKGNYTEEDPVRAVNVYSACKIAAETFALRSAPETVVLRISVVYGKPSPANPGFLGEILRSWRAGKPMNFYTDQYRTPTYGPAVAQVVESFLDAQLPGGIYHVGGAERLSRYEFGIMVAAAVGAPTTLVQPANMPRSGDSAPRGADCSLVSGKLHRVTGITPMPCTEGLRLLAAAGGLRRI
jgi:dTDP-4-dehydrorhamnose reductase